MLTALILCKMPLVIREWKWPDNLNRPRDGLNV